MLWLLKKGETMEASLKTNAHNNSFEGELVNIYEQYSFVNSLIDFEEDIDEWNSRNILPAFPTKNCYIPIPPDSGSSRGMR